MSFSSLADDPLNLKPNFEFRVHKSPVVKLEKSGKSMCAGILRRVRVEKDKEDLFDGDVAIGCEPIVVGGKRSCPKALECKDAAYELEKPFEVESGSNSGSSGANKK